MLFKDKINKFTRFGLTNKVGLYNEDSTTAQELTIECNKKLVECLTEVDKMWADIYKIKDTLALNYADEELVLTLDQRLAEIDEQVKSSYVHLIDEDSMTSLEQAGNQAQAVNECLKAVNMMRTLITDVDNLTSLNYENEELTITTGGME